MHVTAADFSNLLRQAAESDSLPRRARVALRAVAIFRQRNGIRHISQDERRLLAAVPMIASGMVEVDAILDLARRVLTSE